jgi:hypothetical protein
MAIPDTTQTDPPISPGTPPDEHTILSKSDIDRIVAEEKLRA